jgi:hypothetical protein
MTQRSGCLYFWIFALLNYLYADVVALFAIVGSPNLADAPHLPPWLCWVQRSALCNTP